MSLDLYKNFDQVIKERWKICLLIITGISFLAIFSYFTFKNPTPEQTNNLINNSKALQKVDGLCENLSKPENFRFVRKIVSGNSYTVAISHYYQSELGYNKVEAFYLEWFNQNGWILETEGTLDFRKNNLLIHIGKGYLAGANYYIYCAEES